MLPARLCQLGLPAPPPPRSPPFARNSPPCFIQYFFKEKWYSLSGGLPAGRAHPWRSDTHEAATRDPPPHQEARRGHWRASGTNGLPPGRFPCPALAPRPESSCLGPGARDAHATHTGGSLGGQRPRTPGADRWEAAVHIPSDRRGPWARPPIHHWLSPLWRRWARPLRTPPLCPGAPPPS